MEPSPAGFDLFAKAAAGDFGQAIQIARAGITIDRWTATGRLAWAAWSRAQVIYNEEAPLRQNEAAILSAQERLKAAELSAKQGVRVLSDAERVAATDSANDDERSARSRAASWHEQQLAIQQQIAAAENMMRPRSLDPSIGGLHREDGELAPPEARGRILPDPASAPAFIIQRRHDLQSAMLHEDDELHQSERFAAIARDPTLPTSAAQKLQVTQQAQQDADSARSILKRLQDEHARLLQQIAEHGRIAAEASGVDISPADVALVRRQIGAFNALWGLALDGQPIRDDK